MDEVLEQRSVEDGRGFKFLSGDGGADDGEDAGADDGADAERGEAQPAEGFFEAKLGAFTIGNEFVYAFTTEKG